MQPILNAPQPFSNINDLDLEEKNINFVDSPYEYRLKTIFFKNKTVDYVVTRIKHKIPSTNYQPFFGTMTTYQKTLSDEEIAEKQAENIQRAVRRAKKAVHHAVRQISADHLLTLSFRENVTCRKTAFECFHRFIRFVRSKELVNGRLITAPKRDYHYVAVPEMQERGSYHFHCAVVGKQNIPFLRACWYLALGGHESDAKEDARGQIDVQYRQKKWGNTSESFKTFSLVRYMTKYIDKDFENTSEFGQHRYARARDIEKPIEFKQVLMSCSAFGGDFVQAMVEVINMAKFATGLDSSNFILWNRGEDVFVLRSAFID